LQRWIATLDDQNWEIHLFPSMDIGRVHPNFRNIIVHHSIYSPQLNLHPSVKERGLRIGIPFIRNRFSRKFRVIARGLTTVRAYLFPDYRTHALERVINNIKPDIVHAAEFQNSAYLTLKVKEKMGAKFPVWMVTNYGNDIYLYGRLAEHQERVKAVLMQCDYYTCECERDVQLAQSMGLRGKLLPVLPVMGGFDLEHIETISRVSPPSTRRQILLKGYQHYAGRALTGLQAIAQCADVLRDYRIVIYSAFSDVKIAAELYKQDTGLQIEILPPVPYEHMLEQFGKSRIYIGVSISDGISISSLEAMVMGAFPIQSFTACVDEWFEDGISGSIVRPEDVNSIADAIRRSVTDDSLVDTAAEINMKTILERADFQKNKAKIAEIYQQVFKGIDHT
jgi:glycosyltransferase involved in cell wall biosynthesis